MRFSGGRLTPPDRDRQRRTDCRNSAAPVRCKHGLGADAEPRCFECNVAIPPTTMLRPLCFLRYSLASTVRGHDGSGAA
jgi:hypothetical protein